MFTLTRCPSQTRLSGWRTQAHICGSNKVLGQNLSPIPATFFLASALAHWATQDDLSQRIWRSLWFQTLIQATSSGP